MSTGKEFVALNAKRILGWQSFKDHLFDYYREEFHGMFQKVFQRGGTFTALGMVGAGTNQFTLNGFPTSGDDMIAALDPEGYLLAPGERPTEFIGIDFDNENGVDFYVGMRQAEIPGSLFINPGDGLPSFNTYEEVIGYSGEPDLVVDNGNGTLSFEINGITESGRDNSGRKVVVWKKQPGLEAVTDADAVEELIVGYAGSTNTLLTVGNFGQGVTPSTTATDYQVVLLGPYVTTVDLRADDSWTFLGIITGNAGVPTAFDTADQYVMDIPMVQMSDIVRTEAFNSRLKVDVKAYVGESGIDQIRVTKKGSPDQVTFKVDEDGNVTVEGDLTVKGTTTQEDVVTILANEIITGNLTAGDANTDSHTAQGDWTHNVTATPKFTIDGDTGRVGIGGMYSLKDLEVTGDSHFAGEVAIAGDVLPDGVRSLGVDLNKWSYLYVANSYTDSAYLQASVPSLEFKHESGNTDQKFWEWTFSGDNTMVLNLWNDGHSGYNAEVWFERSGTNLTKVIFDCDLEPFNTGADLGSVTKKWGYLYVEETVFTNKVSLSTAASQGMATDVLPAYTSLNFGASSRRWAEIWAVAADFTTLSISTVAGEGVATDFVPTLNGNKTLGNSDYHWGNFYGGNTILKRSRPYAESVDVDADADNKTWIWRFWSENRWVLELANDAKSSFSPRVWFERTLNVLDRIIFDCDLEAYTTGDNLGSPTKKWGNLYVNNTVYTDKLNLSVSASEGAVTDIYPADGAKDLGATDRRWAEIWGVAGDFTTIKLSEVNGEGWVSDILPASIADLNVGSASYPFLNAHFAGVVYGTTLSSTSGVIGTVDTHILKDSADAIIEVQSTLVSSSTGWNLGGIGQRFGSLYLNGVIDCASYIVVANGVRVQGTAGIDLLLRDTSDTTDKQAFVIEQGGDEVIFKSFNNALTSSSPWMTLQRGTDYHALKITFGDTTDAIKLLPFEASVNALLGDSTHRWGGYFSTLFGESIRAEAVNPKLDFKDSNTTEVDHGNFGFRCLNTYTTFNAFNSSFANASEVFRFTNTPGANYTVDIVDFKSEHLIRSSQPFEITDTDSGSPGVTMSSGVTYTGHSVLVSGTPSTTRTIRAVNDSGSGNPSTGYFAIWVGNIQRFVPFFNSAN